MDQSKTRKNPSTTGDDPAKDSQRSMSPHGKMAAFNKILSRSTDKSLSKSLSKQRTYSGPKCIEMCLMNKSDTSKPLRPSASLNQMTCYTSTS